MSMRRQAQKTCVEGMMRSFPVRSYHDAKIENRI